jgi:hypothetical protein
MCLKYILVGFTLPSFYLFLPPLLEQFQQVLLFSYMDTNTLTIYTLIPHFLVPTSPLLIPTSGKDIFLPSCASFFKIIYILIDQRGFALLLYSVYIML